MTAQLLAELGAALPDYHWRYRGQSDTYVGLAKVGTAWLSLWWHNTWIAEVTGPGPSRPPERGPLPVELAVAVHEAYRPVGQRVGDRVSVVKVWPKHYTPERLHALAAAFPALSWGLALFMDGVYARSGAATMVLSVDRFGLFARIEGADRDEDGVFRGKTVERCVEQALASTAWALLTGAERAREAS